MILPHAARFVVPRRASFWLGRVETRAQCKRNVPYDRYFKKIKTIRVFACWVGVARNRCRRPASPEKSSAVWSAATVIHRNAPRAPIDGERPATGAAGTQGQ